MYKRPVHKIPQQLDRAAVMTGDTRPHIPSASLERFVETRFINELEGTGFFAEMTREYAE